MKFTYQWKDKKGEWQNCRYEVYKVKKELGYEVRVLPLFPYNREVE